MEPSLQSKNTLIIDIKQDDTCTPTHRCNGDAFNNLSPLEEMFLEHHPSSSLLPPPVYNAPYSPGAKSRMLETYPMDSTEKIMSKVVSIAESATDDIYIEVPKQERESSIDFLVLEAFAESDYDNDLTTCSYYKQPEYTKFFTKHRPLVPQSILQSSANVYCASLSRCRTKDEHENPSKCSYDVAKRCVQNEFEEDEEDEDEEDEEDAVFMEKGIKEANDLERRKSFSMDRFVFFSSRTKIKQQAPTLKTLLRDDQSFSNLFSTKNGIWWLDCLDPTATELKTISRAFGIHPLTIEDIRQKIDHEKVELFKNYHFLCFNSFNNDEDSEEYLEPINVYLVIFKEGVISFHFAPINHTSNVRRRVRQLCDFVKVSTDWLCYAILDDITGSFAPIIKKLEVEIDFIEESVYLTRKPDFQLMIRRIGESRNIGNLMLRLLSRKADVIKMFAKRYNHHFSNVSEEEMALYLGDIQDHIIQMKQSLSVYEKMLSRSHANYLAQLQVESVDSNNRITKVLGRVTLIGSVLVPLNLVTGLFGMNVRVPGQNGDDLKWFFGVIGFIVALIIIFSVITNNWIVEAETGSELVAEQKNHLSKKRLRNAAKKLNPFASNGEVHKYYQKEH